MYAYTANEDEADSYQRSVRERANASLHELEEALTHSPGTTLNTSARAKDQLTSSVHPRTLRWYEAEGRPQKYRDAVHHLQHIVGDQDTQPPPPHVSRGPGPSPEETAALLHHQAAYVQQLEAENRFMKDEFASVRIKIKDILSENQQLHEELKKSVMEEIMLDSDLLKVVGEADKPGSRPSEVLNSRGQLQQWQIELEKLSALHTAKTERLEIQLTHTREEVQKYEQLVEDLRCQLRTRDTIPTHEDGLTDLYMKDSERGYHQATIDRLSRERTDLMEQVAVLKRKLVEMAEREEGAYEQMKKGIELVEQAQLEQTQAMVQREQLAEELNNMKHRFDGHVQSMQQKISEERDLVRKESQAIIDELNAKIKEQSQQLVAAQTEMGRAIRDKVDVINELEAAKLQIRRYDKEVSMATENFNAESTNSRIQKSQAINEANRLRTELDNLKRDKDQEKSRLNSELDDVRRRLTKAERELVNSKEECIHLTSHTQALERELHLAKLARDSVERGRSEDLKAVAKRSQAREDELKTFITDLEEQHSHTTSEMDTMLAKQNKLIGKLKAECRKQAAQLEVLLKKNRSENGKLRRHNEELRNRLQRATCGLQDLEDQVEQHSRVQEKMTERLKMMDDHAQHQGTQVMELITRQSSLLKDRAILARELEFLRRNISRNNQDEMNKFVSSNKPLVDEVLDNIREEEAEKRDVYVTKQKEPLDIDNM